MGFNSYAGVNIPLTLDNKKFIAAMTEAKGSVGALQAEMSIGLTNAYTKLDYMQRRMDSGIGRSVENLRTLGQTLTTYATIPLALAGAAAMKFYFEMDGIKRGLDAITGSTQQTNSYLSQYLELAKLPGLGFKEVAHHGLVWAALGMNIGTATKLMKEFGNANALGGKGKQEFDTIMFQLTQLQSKGKVIAEDLKPILNASPIIAKSLKDRYNTTDSGDIQKQLEAKGLGSTEFINTLVQDLSKLERVTTGAKNAWENFTDSLFIAAAAVGGFLEKGTSVSNIMDYLGEKLRDFAKWLNEMPLAWKQLISGLLLFTIAAGPALTVLSSFLKLFIAVNGSKTILMGLAANFSGLWAILASSPITSVILGFTALVAIIKLLNSESNKAAESQSKLANLMTDAKANASIETESLQKLAKVAGDKSQSDEKRANAVKKLNEYAPEYLGNITAENIGTAKSVETIKNYIVYLNKKTVFEALNTEVSIRRAEAERLKQMDPTANIGFWDKFKSFMVGAVTSYSVSSLDITKHRIKTETEAALNAWNDAAIKLHGAEKEFDEAFGKMKVVKGKKNGGGKIETEKQALRELNSEMQETIKNLNHLEKEMEGWDKENGIEKWSKPKEPMAFAYSTGGQFGSFNKGAKGVTKEGLSAWGDNQIGKFKVDDVKSNLTDLSNTYVNGFQNIAGSVSDGLGQMTEAWVNGTFTWQEAGANFTAMLGGLMTSMGQSFVTMGVAKLAADFFKTTTLGGGALIAIGAGLQVAGGALKGQATKIGKGGQTGNSSGSIGSYNSPTFGGTSGGGSSNYGKPTEIIVNINGMLTASGTDLVYVINRQVAINARA